MSGVLVEIVTSVIWSVTKCILSTKGSRAKSGRNPWNC